MKKALLLVLCIVAVCFLIANADYLATFLATLQTGALVPLVIATLFMLARHLVQASSYNAAFDAVGHRTGFWHNVVLIFSLVFINTFCLFSGATGVAFIIDDAYRTGADAGQSTSGAILSQIGYFAAIMVISVIGFVTMLLAGSMNTLFLVGGLALAGVLVVLSSLFVVGFRKPRILFRVFLVVEGLANKVLRLIKKHLKPGWGRKTAGSFVSSANILAKNPQGTLITVAYASLSAILNMACLVAIGYAFGFENVSALVAAFAVAAISVILSPTPQGVGVVEAAIAAILTANGCSLATATAIALVYRGIMFWVPFCFGAVLLSRSGFFAEKKDPSEEHRAKDTAWVFGTLVLVIGLVNAGMALIPQTFEPFTSLTSWIDIGGLLIGPTLIVASVVLVVLAVGLILRLRTAWAITVTALILVAGGEFLYVNTWQVALAAVVLTVFLFWKRDVFDRPLVPREDALRLVDEFRENVARFGAWRTEGKAARVDKAAHASKATRTSGVAYTSETKPAPEATAPSRFGRAIHTQQSSHNVHTASKGRSRLPYGRTAVREHTKTDWERQAEQGAEIVREAQREGVLPLDDVSFIVAGIPGTLSAAPSKEESHHDSAR